MAMQKIYGIIFTVGGSTPGKTSVEDAFNAAREAVGQDVFFKLEEYTSFSEKHGKHFTNQSLASLSIAPVAVGDFS